MELLGGSVSSIGPAMVRSATSSLTDSNSNGGVVLVGAAQTGKTTLVNAVLAAANGGDRAVRVVRITRPPRTMQQCVDVLHSLTTALEDADEQQEPVAVFLDGLQVLLPAVKRTALEHKFQVLLLRALKQLRRHRGRLFLWLVCTCEPGFDTTLLSAALLPGMQRLELRNPCHSERVAQISQCPATALASSAEYVAQRTSGWTRGEINSFLCSLPGDDDVDALLGQFRKQTSLFRETAVMQQTDSTELLLLPELGGLIKAKSLLDRLVVQFFAANTSSSGIRGVLLHGESGNGKTMLGLHLGQQVQLTGTANFFCVKCLDLVSKVVGETETNVARIFTRARESAPCLLFLDQLDALAPRRSTDEDGGGDSTSERTFDRVLTVLLVELDGILTKQQQHQQQQQQGAGAGVVVMAATRSVECLEPALVRPGRLGTHVFVPAADTVEEKLAVLRACTRGMPLEDGVLAQLPSLLRASETRADLANLCREAAMCALREHGVASSAGAVSVRHFEAAAAAARGSNAVV